MPRKYPKDPTNKRVMSRSTKLRKYGSVYKSYVRKVEQSRISKSPRRSRNKMSKTQKVKTNDKKTPTQKISIKRKPLNAYQKFVKCESKKEKYKKIPGRERLSHMANEWKKINIK